MELISSILAITFVAKIVSLTVIVPISLILAIFRKTGKVAGIGLMISTGVFALDLWLWSAVIIYQGAGLIVMIVGILLAGVGVFPVAIIVSALHREWMIAGYIIFALVVIRLLYRLARYLIERPSRKLSIEQSDTL
jgi:hypothetical protein